MLAFDTSSQSVVNGKHAPLASSQQYGSLLSVNLSTDTLNVSQRTIKTKHATVHSILETRRNEFRNMSKLRYSCENIKGEVHFWRH